MNLRLNYAFLLILSTCLWLPCQVMSADTDPLVDSDQPVDFDPSLDFGPTLPRMIEAALEGNRDLQEARERIDEVHADQVVVRSRLMPHVSLSASYDGLRTGARGEIEDDVSSQLLYQQRLFEFGPHAAQEVRLRSDLRNAMFEYEDQVYTVLSRVWEVYHLILLKNEQITLRQASRDSFEVFLQKQTARFDERLASEEDMLQAELNVLNEELQINSLQRQQFNDKMELLRLVGRPIGASISPSGSLAPMTIDQNEAVQIALTRDVQIGLNTQLLAEQQRVVREQRWEYAPDLSLQAGVDDGRRSASVTIDRESKTWGVDMAAGLSLDEARTHVPEDGATWRTQLQARIPLFEGGIRIGQETLERARLRQIEIRLRDLKAGVELRVRQAFQSMLEAEEEARLQERFVRIARRRLEINQFLQEKGQADEAKLEAVRSAFFSAQDRLFSNQRTYITRQAQLRRLMGYVE